GGFGIFWGGVGAEPRLTEICRRTIVVEQPVHRDRALADEAGDALKRWTDRPPLIIDDAEGAVGAVRRALAVGYAGASYKNCKGIIKGIANACLLAERRGQGQAG